MKNIDEILYDFGDTYLAISGSTDDVDLIAKEHEKLIFQAQLSILGWVKSKVPKEKKEQYYHGDAILGKEYNQCRADFLKEIERMGK